MFTTVRYFVKSSIIFLLAGILTGVYMEIATNVLHRGVGADLVSAHTHVLLVGCVMMMIMGVALWFFPRAEKDDPRYNPDLILATFWILALATGVRFVAQVVNAFVPLSELGWLVTLGGVMQGVGMALYFYAIWGRIRAVGSQFREAKGEKF